ncbi:hypothetical protein BGZ49_006387, partial [Haplosporangium sp. Z 27]
MDEPDTDDEAMADMALREKSKSSWMPLSLPIDSAVWPERGVDKEIKWTLEQAHESTPIACDLTNEAQPGESESECSGSSGPQKPKSKSKPKPEAAVVKSTKDKIQ